MTETADNTIPQTAADGPGAQTPLQVTPEALAIVLGVRAQEDDPERTALRVAITGSSMVEYTYALDLVSLDEATDDDLVYTQGEHGELSVIVPKASAPDMIGAALDVPVNSANGGLVIRNPNQPNPLDGLDIPADADLGTKAQAVLDGAINPSLAAHGGFASLVGVDGTVVTVTMGGGCQGCAASAMTLRQGITKMLQDALPEISEVVDATDHTAGENPFYS